VEVSLRLECCEISVAVHDNRFIVKDRIIVGGELTLLVVGGFPAFVVPNLLALSELVAGVIICAPMAARTAALVVYHFTSTSVKSHVGKCCCMNCLAARNAALSVV
jgi:hypothetical protein